MLDKFILGLAYVATIMGLLIINSIFFSLVALVFWLFTH